MTGNDFSFTCPYCGCKQVVTSARRDTKSVSIDVGSVKGGPYSVVVHSASCASESCEEITILIILYPKIYKQNFGWVIDTENPVKTERWVPESDRKIFPEYVPAPIRENYYEACLIRSKSPKAAATLARRCLQGMIRDFCGVSKSRLIDEIRELDKRLQEDRLPSGVTPESISAIDDVRSVGNIGAHMERDISLIVPVDPNEAQLLIELIEMLVEDWYIAREQRMQRLQKLKHLAESKRQIASGSIPDLTD